MNQKQEHHIIDILFVIALFCMFALSAIFLISVGADIYGKTVSHMESNFNSRTAFAYVTEKVRQADAASAIDIGQLDGIPALTITQTMGDTQYITYLYQHENHLKELMVREDTPLGPAAGQDILTLTDFCLSKVSDNLYSFSLTTEDGNTCKLYVSTKSTGGNAHEK